MKDYSVLIDTRAMRSVKRVIFDDRVQPVANIDQIVDPIILEEWETLYRIPLCNGTFTSIAMLLNIVQHKYVSEMYCNAKSSNGICPNEGSMRNRNMLKVIISVLEQRSIKKFILEMFRSSDSFLQI